MTTFGESADRLSLLLRSLQPGGQAIAVDLPNSPCVAALLKCELAIHHLWPRFYRDTAEAEHLRGHFGLDIERYSRYAVGGDDLDIEIYRAPSVTRPMSRNGWETLKIRNLDSLFAGLNELRALCVLDGPNVFDVLRGSSELLSRHRPLVVFGSFTAAVFPADHMGPTTDLLIRHHYAIFDLRGDPISNPAFGRSDSVYIAVPDASADGRPADSRLFFVVQPGLQSWLDGAIPTSEQSLPKPTAGRPRLTSNCFDSEPRPNDVRGFNWSHTEYCDAAFPGEGWWPAEGGSAGNGWRWSGPRNVSSVRLLVPSPGRYGLEFRIINEVRSGLSSQVRVFSNDGELNYVASGAEYWNRFFFISEIDISAISFLGWIDLEIVLPRVYPSNDDDRVLGICLSAVHLRRFEPETLPIIGPESSNDA